jgi:hypothetical protein
MKSDKELYRRLRELSPDVLWNQEVPRFNAAPARERQSGVALIRAVGVAFAGSGSAERKREVRAWLKSLLNDPSEKVRRYAMTALPKLGAGRAEERELVGLLKSRGDRERRSVMKALDKIGGVETLRQAPSDLHPLTEQKLKARVARTQAPSSIRMQKRLDRWAGLRIHLRCRRGLEEIVRDELEQAVQAGAPFRIIETARSYVALAARGPFSLGDLYRLRCFATVHLVLGCLRGQKADQSEAIADQIASPLTYELMRTFTEGPLRYRLAFIAKGHQRGAIRHVVGRAYALRPEILNDAKSAPWAIELFPVRQGVSVELRPRLYPDPRFYYRTDDVEAASHPPLAACMARIAGRADNEVVWDPFCGSGLELVECALLGGVKQVYGTDISPEAVAIAKANFAAARLGSVQGTFVCCDFKDRASVPGLGPASVTLVVTNPPMGRRIRIGDMRGLIGSLFDAAENVLKPGGRLVFPNPLRMGPRGKGLQLQYREAVDLGGFDCRLEVYVRK